MRPSDQPPPYSYVAFIDEAGDDGLKRVRPFSPHGSSEWLVLAAVVVRAENQTQLASWLEQIESKLFRHTASSIHFSKLSERNKRIVCTEIAKLPIRCFVVASNKKNMEGYENPDAGKIPSQCWFYCWMTRLLLERVTRFVEQQSVRDHGEVRLLRLEYSARGGLRYSQMNAYYEWMRLKRRKPFLPWGHVHFDVMHPRLMRVYPHTERDGLQIADVVASAFFKACDKRSSPACNSEFARLLHPRMAREPDKIGGQIAGFGVKLLPNMKRAQLDEDQADIFRFFGYPRQWWDPEAFSKGSYRLTPNRSN